MLRGLGLYISIGGIPAVSRRVVNALHRSCVDLGTFVSELEGLVKNHSRCVLQENNERVKVCPKSLTTCQDDCYTLNITLDIFAKLHQMLHNYIGLFNFRGSKLHDFDSLKIPLIEALDVSVRAMISAMQSCVSKEPFSTPVVCLNSTPTSGCSKCQSVNANAKCEFDKLPEIQEVDKKLQRLKSMNVGSCENVEAYIKDILRGITKLPLAVMTSRLEILSSVVRNTKNKLTSCGRPSAASLMGTQVNSISQIISEFILEYGQIKSKIFPCRKICRFCGSVMCPVDRERNIFCCENAKHLNFLWEEWTRKNSVKGVAEWDEDTIISIVDSLKDIPMERSTCVRGEPSTILGKTAAGGQQNSELGHQVGEGKSNEKNQRGDRKQRNEQGYGISSHFSQGENQGVANSLRSRGLRNSENQNKIGRSGTEKKRDSGDPGKETPFEGNQKQAKDKRQKTRLHNSNIQSTAERRISETSDVDKSSRKKHSKKATSAESAPRSAGRLGNLTKHTSEMKLSDGDDELGVGERKKGARNERGEVKKLEGDPKNKRREKSQRKKDGMGVNIQGEFFNENPDQRIGNTGEPSGVESSKKEQDNGKGAKETGGHETGRTDKIDGEIRSGTKTREKYSKADGKRSSAGGIRREMKSGNGTHGDSENIIRYQLSNELFIKLGWTKLPKDTTMRRVVEFQALLAKPHMNWLKNNRIHGTQYYSDNKTVFINFCEDGSGHICYPNGETAIAAQISKKGTHELYKVYEQGGRDVMGVVRQPWLMGVFDSVGNGVVYDEDCNVRITYNQNGGVYVDNPAKVPFSWGWNNFQTFPIDEAVYEDPSLDEIPPEMIPEREVKDSSSKTSKQSNWSKGRNSPKLNEAATVSVEDQKLIPQEPVKVIPNKLITPLKPICLKLNKYLSLRILDRKNINLQFFAGSKCVRIELGTEVNPNVQIASELVDHDDWTAKMTKSRFHVDMNEVTSNQLSPESSLVQIAKEFQHTKNEANSRQQMIAKYRPQLISTRLNTAS